MLIYVKDTQDIMTIAEGTGDNLTEEDIKEGYRDYAMVDTKHYEPDGYLYDVEGSQLMLYDSYKFYTPRVIIEKSLDIIYGKTDLDYIILNDD